MKLQKLLLVAATLTAMCACNKKEDFFIKVDSYAIELSCEAGSDHIMVYSSGSWNAALENEIDWGSINKNSGSGDGEIVFTYQANNGVSREVNLIVFKDGVAETINIIQKGVVTDPQMKIVPAEAKLINMNSDLRLEFHNNFESSVQDVKIFVAEYKDGQAGEAIPAEELGEQNWIHSCSLDSEFLYFSVRKNNTGAERVAEIILSITPSGGYEAKTSVKLTQGTDGATFAFVKSEDVYSGTEGNYLAAVTENNIMVYDYKTEVKYTDGEDWISNVKVQEDGLTFDLAKNSTGADRKAVIEISFADEVIAALSLTQEAYFGLMTFEELFACEAGELPVDRSLQGYVVSDPSSENVAAAKRLKQGNAADKADRTENKKTVYIESTDGRFGVCAKFETVEDNTLARYDKVIISFKDVTLEKLTNPSCCILRGLTADNILKVEAGQANDIPVKSRTIASLTDDDIFTYVNVTDLEILFKDGSFTNMLEGYVFKGVHGTGDATYSRSGDVAPLLCTDNAGNSIYMLTNINVLWRRALTGTEWGTVVPQGSGTFKGILTAHEDFCSQHYGNLGKYQLRALNKEEIEFTSPAFSRTIVEWTWNDLVNDTLPESGEGEIDLNGATAALAMDFNNTSIEKGNGANQAGAVKNAALTVSNKWWDFAANTGKWFDISFSTSGISGSNLIVGFDWNHGDLNNSTLDSPAHWKLLYSTDGGSEFKEVPNCEIIKNRSMCFYSGAPVDLCPGLMNHLRKLPSDCFGKEKVIVRFQVADKVTDKNAGLAKDGSIETAELTDKATKICIGSLTVRYN